MTYRFKLTAEFWWFVLVTFAVALLTPLITFEPEKITDWKTWAVSLVAGGIRAVAGAVIAYVTKGVAG